MEIVTVIRRGDDLRPTGVGPRLAYRYKVAREKFHRHPSIDRVSFAERGDGEPLRAPEQGEIIYVLATGGRWGKSSEVRASRDLSERDAECRKLAELAEGLGVDWRPEEAIAEDHYA